MDEGFLGADWTKERSRISIFTSPNAGRRKTDERDRNNIRSKVAYEKKIV